jgi:hypothetical protein
MSGPLIPGKIVRFLENANVAFAGTRDSRLVPHGHRVSGWLVGSDGRTITALIAEMSRPHLLEALLDNGQISMTTEQYPSHEAYQFKGRYLRHRPVGPADVEAVDRTRERFMRVARSFYPPEAEHAFQAFTPEPGIAIEFEVREIFVQTPGPGAGARLFPAEPA